MRGETELQIIRQMMTVALEVAGGNKTLAAELMGINRTTMLMRMKRWGMGSPKRGQLNLPLQGVE